jgi:hypothetical protein
MEGVHDRDGISAGEDLVAHDECSHTSSNL